MKKALYILISLCFINSVSGQTIIRIAGNGSISDGGNGGPALKAGINSPFNVAYDYKGNLYIADYNGITVRKVNTSGIISIFAGNGHYGHTGDGGPATAAEINDAVGLACDSKGNVYVCGDYGYVRKIDTNGIITTFAGNGNTYGFCGGNIPATAACINYPTGIAFDKKGNCYISDEDNDNVVKVDTSGILTLFAGNGHGGYSGDGGPATAAEFWDPRAVAADSKGNIYVADQFSEAVRMIDTAGIIHTFIGSGHFGYSGDGGPATSAEIGDPTGLTVDACNNVYVSDLYYNVVRVVDDSGIIRTISGQGSSLADSIPADSAALDDPEGLCIDLTGNLVMAQAQEYDVEKIIGLQCSVWGSTKEINLKCAYFGTGTAIITATGGMVPYTYSWSPSISTTDSAFGLSPGTYVVKVTDANKYSFIDTIVITQPAVLALNRGSSADTNGCIGSAWVVPNGGTSPYNYLWTSGQTTDTITNQCLGIYCCTVTDKQGCSNVVCIDITQTGISTIVNNSSLNIYPNPSNGVFTFQASIVTSQLSVVIYNLLGEKVYSKLSIVNSPLSIDLRNLPNGIYLYRVIKKDGSLLGDGKLIIQK